MDARKPYDSNPAADLVLRSSDNIYFYVLGSLLRFVSPFFMDMYLINKGPSVEDNETMDGRPVVSLEEDSGTLHLLLDSLYPCAKDAPLTDVALFWKVGKASKKYCMDVVEEQLQNRIVTSDLIGTEPLRVFAVAIDLGWDGVANEAARLTLGIPLETIPFVEELRSITGSGFYRFLEYRIRCDASKNPKGENLINLPKTAVRDPAETDPTSISDAKTSAPVSAPESFSSSEHSDLILRSSDSIDYFVVEALIRLVSQDFDTVFTSCSKTEDGKRLIQVQEDSGTLHQLLSIIHYYIDEPDIRDYRSFKSVVEAARAHNMDVIQRKLRKQALSSPFIVDEPLKVYILATTLGWEDVAHLAALNTLTRPLQEMAYIEELDWITGEDLYKLLHFRFKCAEKTSQYLRSNYDFQQYGPSRFRDFQYNHYYDDRGVITFEQLELELKACPRGSTIMGIYRAELTKLEINSGNSRTSWNATTVLKFLKCWNIVENGVEEAIKEVSLGTYPLIQAE